MLEYWNSLKKPDNVNVKAVKGDIVEKIDGVLFLLQTTMDYNNVVAYRVKPSDKFIIWTFYKYCILLHDKYNINYIRIEGNKGKYDFLKSFTKKQIIKDDSIEDRDVYYCNLKAVYKTISLKEKELQFYYLQKMYKKTKNEIYYNKMFFLVKDAVEASVKKKSKKHKINEDDLHDFVIDGTIKIMGRIKNKQDYTIKYLLTAAYYVALNELYNKKQKFWDKCLSYEEYLKRGIDEEC